VRSTGRKVSTLAKVALCKINTDRFRQMSYVQLSKATQRIGYLFDFPERIKRDDRRRINKLLSNFLFNLRGYREGRLSTPITDENAAIYRRRFNEEPAPNARIKEHYRSEAERAERKIWDAQAKAGCTLKPEELVARDAAREGNDRVANRLRKKATISGLRGRRR
jgi:hypothetical protein